MLYRLPEMKDRELLRAYVKEHADRGENSLSASHGLSGSEYPEWVEKIRRYAVTGDDEKKHILLYLSFDGDRLVGLLSVRYELSRELAERIGHIGYGVRPSERNKGYATAMLGYALSVCREKGLKEVIVGCYKDNLASAATIRKNGGVLMAENDSYHEGVISQYYRIGLQG